MPGIDDFLLHDVLRQVCAATWPAVGRHSFVPVQEQLGVLLEKEDEMDCLVGGANFLLKAIHHEAFMYENSQTLFTPSNCEHASLVMPYM